MLTAQEKATWIKELRDPNNKQCRNYSRLGDARCANQVLYDIIPHKKEAIVFGNAHVRAPFLEILDMNDYKNNTFPEIADWIEANIEVTP